MVVCGCRVLLVVRVPGVGGRVRGGPVVHGVPVEVAVPVGHAHAVLVPERGREVPRRHRRALCQQTTVSLLFSSTLQWQNAVSLFLCFPRKLYTRPHAKQRR